MRSIIFDFADNNEQNLYIQIFDYIKGKILSGEFELGMKLPSLRQLAKENGISVTTVETAYNQLRSARSSTTRRVSSSRSGRSA